MLHCLPVDAATSGLLTVQDVTKTILSACTTPLHAIILSVGPPVMALLPLAPTALRDDLLAWGFCVCSIQDIDASFCVNRGPEN